MSGCVVVGIAVLLPFAMAQEPPGRYGKPVNDSKLYTMILVDQLEHGLDYPSNRLRFNAQSWTGGDYNRVWFYTEGTTRDNGNLEDFDFQVLYGRMIAPFWDVQAGARYFRPNPAGPSRGDVVLGFRGMAPYRFDIQAASFISYKGEVSGRIEVEYDILLTQRLIAQPRIETNIAVQSVPEMRIGRGFNDAELGIRIRYEIRREFAPYAGVVWTSKFGQTADFARLDKDPTQNLGFVVGIRMWR